MTAALTILAGYITCCAVFVAWSAVRALADIWRAICSFQPEREG